MDGWMDDWVGGETERIGARGIGRLAPAAFLAVPTLASSGRPTGFGSESVPTACFFSLIRTMVLNASLCSFSQQNFLFGVLVESLLISPILKINPSKCLLGRQAEREVPSQRLILTSVDSTAFGLLFNYIFFCFHFILLIW